MVIFAFSEKPAICRIDCFPTPWGDMRIAVCGEKLIVSAYWINDKASEFGPFPEYEGVALVNPTEFEKDVFGTLLAVKLGETITYSELAVRAGYPGAARAAGNLMARNNVALFLPCHRVLPAGGGIGRYRWGAERKREILEFERSIIQCRTDSSCRRL